MASQWLSGPTDNPSRIAHKPPSGGCSFARAKRVTSKVAMTKPPNQRVGLDPEHDMIELVSHMHKLSSGMHALKNDVAENSKLTQATFDRQIEFETRQTAKLDDMAKQSEEMLAVFNAGKKGVSFFQGLGRLLFNLARWSLPILGAGGALWALFHGQPPKGSE